MLALRGAAGVHGVRGVRDLEATMTPLREKQWKKDGWLDEYFKFLKL